MDGLIKLMRQEETVGPVNIGNPVETTIKELAETIVELTGSSSKIVYKPLPKDDPKRRRPDITRARAVMGWEPAVSLRGGLAKTIEYFSALDLRWFKRPTKHTAHATSELESARVSAEGV